MILIVQQIGKLLAIFIVMNGTEYRIDEGTEKMLVTFKEVFGEVFIRNIAFFFTHWNQGKKAKK